MTTEKKIELLADVFDVETGEITPESVLADQSYWCSMAKLALIVLIDEEFGKKLKSDIIREFITIQDILDYME